MNRATGAATLSACGRYRFMLRRDWPSDLFGTSRRCITFLMLNPSTADAELDDPTITRCMGFVRREGGVRLEVVNLYALRATDPARLCGTLEPTGGKGNDAAIVAAAVASDSVICAWGAWRPRNPAARVAHDERVKDVLFMLRHTGRPLLCLGRTVEGAPRHPLYVAADTRFEVFTG